MSARIQPARVQARSVVNPAWSPLKILDRFLVTRLLVTAAELKIRKWPYHLEESIPKEPRLMLIREGAANYRVDDFRCKLLGGQMILMPAWVSREWRVAKRPGITALAWCRFSSAEYAFEDLAQPIVHSVGDLPLEVASFTRITLLLEKGGTGAMLEAEAELKAILGRFLAHVSEPKAALSRPSSGGEQGVQRAIEHLKSHFKEPNALHMAPKIAGLNPKYFRSLFRKYTGVTPGSYLMQLRMRAARYLQHESNLRVKEVAASVGYADPFYFSRLYRRYWGHAPTDDRRPVEEAGQSGKPRA